MLISSPSATRHPHRHLSVFFATLAVAFVHIYKYIRTRTLTHARSRIVIWTAEEECLYSNVLTKFYFFSRARTLLHCVLYIITVNMYYAPL
jgi:hypothetical protein